MKITQKDRILNHLMKYGSITTWEAIKEYGITRLSDKIFRLRRENYNITDEWETTKNRYGDKVSYKKYRLERSD